MKRQLKNKLQCISIILTAIIFLFPKNAVFAGESTDSSKRAFQNKTFAYILTVVGDGIQIFINATATNTKITDNLGLLAVSDDIKQNEELQNQIQVKKPKTYKKTKTKTLKEVTISNNMDNEAGESEQVFSEETPIPIIPIDLYSSSIDKIDLLDIDFLSPNNKNLDTRWNYLKDIVSTYSHIILYLSAALLVSMLIWRSIVFVRASLGGNPEQASESKKIIDKWIKAILLVVGAYIIAELMIYSYHIMVKIVMNGNDSNYLIRIIVEDTYSFNTNLIGWAKYKTLMSDGFAVLGWSIIYTIVAAIDLVWFFVMFVRMIAVGLLIIVAPLTAVMSMGERTQKKGKITNFLHFKSWIRFLTICVWMPMVVVISQRIFLSL